MEVMANEALIDSMKIFGNFELKSINRNIQLIKDYYSPHKQEEIAYYEEKIQYKKLNEIEIHEERRKHTTYDLGDYGK